ncbi:MAG: alpha/beta fold hydrolase [Acidobacteria bacterium]|nr:alpha/beta fold hydrolase [Acidobacteriota bacterium]
MKVIYCHGFASSPESSKARFFASKLAECGVECVVPALDGGDFENLTVTGQLRILEAEADGKPVHLVGSSLGGYLSALYAAAHPEQVQKLILLAPAFCFGSRYPGELRPDDLSAWKANGTRKIFHYGHEREMDLRYALVEDAAKYADFPDFRQPALILHGRKDDVVPSSLSETFAASHPNATLRILESDHQLTDVTDILWRESKLFFGL